MKEALEVVKQHNLCTYYLLPLINLNKHSFGVLDNFINSYVNSQGTELYVKCHYLGMTVSSNPHLIRTQGVLGSSVYVFSLPERWQQDFQQYRQGKYSQFSPDAKDLIRNQSGLRYRAINDNGILITDIRLLAIESDPDRRNILRRELSGYLEAPIEENAELLDAPNDNSFVERSQSLTA